MYNYEISVNILQGATVTVGGILSYRALEEPYLLVGGELTLQWAIACNPTWE